jgi:hypothetical protein
MEKINLSIKSFAFEATFIITEAVIKKLRAALVTTSNLIDFGTDFVINGNSDLLRNELQNLCDTKKHSMQPEEFEHQVLSLIFQHHYNKNFENENFKQLITLVAEKSKLRRKITILFAKNIDDLKHEAKEDPNLISDMDNTSTVIFPLFIQMDQVVDFRPFETTQAILALPRPVFFIPKKGSRYIETDYYTVDYDVALFKKLWNSNTTQKQAHLKQ